MTRAKKGKQVRYPGGIRPTILAIEGLIGAGKSSLLAALRNSYLAVKYALFVVEEPTSRWQNVAGCNLLQLYYENPERYAFAFQSWCLTTRFEMVEEYLKYTTPIDHRPVLILLERSWVTDYACFATLRHQYGQLEGVELRLLYHQMCTGSHHVPPVDGFIVLDVPVNTALNRMLARGRAGECSGVTEKYQTDLKDQHDRWIRTLTTPHMRINGRLAFHTQPASPVCVQNVVNSIHQFINDIQHVKGEIDSGAYTSGCKVRSRSNSLQVPPALPPPPPPPSPVLAPKPVRTRSGSDPTHALPLEIPTHIPALDLPPPMCGELTRDMLSSQSLYSMSSMSSMSFTDSESDGDTEEEKHEEVNESGEAEDHIEPLKDDVSGRDKVPPKKWARNLRKFPVPVNARGTIMHLLSSMSTMTTTTTTTTTANQSM